MIKKIYIYLIIMSLALTGCSPSSDLATHTIQANTWYTVADFVDGDTFKIQTGTETTTIRLLYIDTPETKKANTPVEPYGPEASAFTKNLLLESEEVRLSFDKEQTDQYDRTLAIVELRDGRILNELLLEQGLAQVLIVEPNVKMENVYKQIEQNARQNKIGIWSSSAGTIHSDIPVKKAETSGITIEVDKKAELVTITNTNDEAISLEGWKLVSVRGNQIYPFESYELNPKQKVMISSAEEISTKEANMLQWGATNIWNNNESDPAELYNVYNELVAVWED